MDSNVNACVSRYFQNRGESIDSVSDKGITPADSQVTEIMARCGTISSQNLLKNIQCTLGVGPTRCDEVYVLETAPTTPLTLDQLVTAFIGDRAIGRAQIETGQARSARLAALNQRRKAATADSALKKVAPLLDPKNTFAFKRATDLRNKINAALRSDKATPSDLEGLEASVTGLVSANLANVERLRLEQERMRQRGEVEVVGQGSAPSRRPAQINAYYDVFEKQLRELIGNQADGPIGQQFKKTVNSSFDKFKADYFAGATKENCRKAGNAFTCSIEGVFKAGTLKSEVQKLMSATVDNHRKSYRFILGYEETEHAPTRFLIDNIRAEFINAGYRIIARGGEDEARARGDFDFYLNILDIEYDDSNSDVGGSGSSVFENYVLKARVKLLDNAKDPAARQELANVAVINTKRAPRDASMPRDARRNQLLPTQASELARNIHRDISARVLTIASKQDAGATQAVVRTSGQYSVKLTGLGQRDREKIRLLRNAITKTISGVETRVDPKGTTDKSVEIVFEHAGKFDPEDLVDAIYDAFKGSKNLKIQYEGNNAFVGAM